MHWEPWHGAKAQPPTTLHRKCPRGPLCVPFTIQLDTCQCKLWQIRNDDSNVATTGKANKIGRLVRISYSMGKHAKRKQLRVGALHNSVVLPVLLPSQINAKKLSLFPLLAYYSLRWQKAFSLPGKYVTGWFSKKWKMMAIFTSNGYQMKQSMVLCFLVSIIGSSLCRAIIKTTSLLCALLVYTNHVRSINHGILKCNRVCKEY